MKWEIRRMCLEDLPQVIAIDRVSFSLPWPERAFGFEVMGNPAARNWVVEQDGQILAMLVIWLILDEAHVATIATHPEYRRQGIGEALLLEALASAQAEGAVRAFLEVRSGNSGAQAMYRKYGFVVDGLRKRYYKDNNEDAVLMSLDLQGLDLAALSARQVEDDGRA